MAPSVQGQDGLELALHQGVLRDTLQPLAAQIAQLHRCVKTSASRPHSHYRCKHADAPSCAPAATRRVGGGFGGKTTRPMPYAAMCAVAANKLQQQVRLTLNRNTDLRLNGGEAAQHMSSS